MSDSAEQPTHYVGIGASAGGLEAIEQLFANMPPRTGMAFVVIQHLSPDYKSLMVDLVAKYTSMTVGHAEDGAVARPDHVYLIPPNHNLSIAGGRFRLERQSREHGINLPIDLFLKSLAFDQRDRSVAVILSGTGSDGTRGIRAIKDQLGLVLVQDPASAAFDGMPNNAISTGLVDFVLEPAQMPDKIVRATSTGTSAPLALDSAAEEHRGQLASVFGELRRHTRVDFSHYKSSTILRRLQRRMTMSQQRDISGYVSLLKSDPGEVDRLYHDLLIGVTSFFRDADAFALLRENHLPELLQSGDDDLRFWVPGCSSGEEAFSLAILTEELQRQLGLRRNYRIFATDADEQAIARASAGAFNESIAADVDRSLLARYFTRDGDSFRVSRQLRERVVFAHHNVIQDPPFTNISLLSCRNLLIYLEPVLQRKVLDYFAFSLKPGGLLFLGSSESVGDRSDYFETLDAKWRIYRATARARRVHLNNPPLNRPSRVHHAARLAGSGALQEDRLLERLFQGLSGDIIPFCMVVDEDLQLLHVSGQPAPYLRLAPGRVSSQLTKLVCEELLVPVSSGLQKIFADGKERLLTNVRVGDGDDRHPVSVRIRALPGKAGQPPMAAVLIEPEQRPGSHEEAAVDYDADHEQRQRIEVLEQELQFTRENLQATVEELETSNEELQATNEELLSSNEELHSTNEELQSVNEELHTVNSEFQSKIVELTDANNDLDNLFSNIRLPVLFLDENRDIRLFTPEAADLFRVMEKDIGRPIGYVAHRFVEIDLGAMLDAVAASGSALESETGDDRGAFYRLRIMPYQVARDVFAGFVLVAIDESQDRRQAQAAANRGRLEQLIQRERGIGSWTLDAQTLKMTWSAGAEMLFGSERAGLPSTLEGFIKYLPDDQHHIAETAISGALRDGARFVISHDIEGRDGVRRAVVETGIAHLDADGRVDKIITMIEDENQADADP